MTHYETAAEAERRRRRAHISGVRAAEAERGLPLTPFEAPDFGQPQCMSVEPAPLPSLRERIEGRS